MKIVSQEASHALYVWIWIRFFLFLSSSPQPSAIHTSETITLTSLDTPDGKGRMEKWVFGEIQCHVDEEPSKAIPSLLLHTCSVSKAAKLTGTFELETGEK